MGKVQASANWNEMDVMQWVTEETPHVASREDVAALFSIDRTEGIVDRPTIEQLAVAIAHWIVWDQRPTGIVTEEGAEWLIALAGPRPSTFGRAILFAIVREAESVPERLSIHIMKASVGRALLI